VPPRVVRALSYSCQTTEPLGEQAAEEYVAVARRWDDFDLPFEESQQLLGQGRCLVGPGRADGATF
jgi:hypothetical protein